MTAVAARVRWACADGWTLARRDLQHWRRDPTPVVFALAFPVLITVMFGYLFGGAMTVPGGGDYRSFLMPGMFAMVMVFGVAETVAAVRADADRGITDRFRALPMASSAVVAGRAAADMINAVLVLAVMLGCGLAVGWRPHGGAAATLHAVGLLLLLRFAFVWLGVYLGLVIRASGAVTAVQALEFPVGFLANVFVAPSTMPGWLGTVAEWNPLSATVSATRELFGNPGAGGASWVAGHAQLMAVVWPLLLLAVFVPLSVRRWRRLSR